MLCAKEALVGRANEGPRDEEEGRVGDKVCGSADCLEGDSIGLPRVSGGTSVVKDDLGRTCRTGVAIGLPLTGSGDVIVSSGVPTSSK